MDKFLAFIKSHKKAVTVISAIVPLLVVGAVVMLTGGLWSAGAGESTALPASNNISPTVRASADSASRAIGGSADVTSTTAAEGDIPFATAPVAASPADYQSQWDAGYLVAIDNPDYSYACYHVELTDDDRELLECLCYGEFGSGGFIGAAMIAQCVKDAMCFDGYSSVADVIKYCRYDGSTTSGTSDECIQAVRYIFDDDGSAVQHRMLYMYNPYMVKSSFHESQEFVLSYQGVRFFDR